MIETLDVGSGQWEYVIGRWSFVGPHLDDWPEHDSYVEAWHRWILEETNLPLMRPSRDAMASPEARAFRERYNAWTLSAESLLLADYGDAGFELVAVHRDVQRGQGSTTWDYPTYRVQVYFKRPKRVGAPDAPKRSIGFQPIVECKKRAPARTRKPKVPR